MSLGLPWVHITTAILVMLTFYERTCTCSSWQTISECTVTTSTGNYSKATTILNCGFDKILIGWSHYGVHPPGTGRFDRCQPKLTDCVMDYTDKIAELCDGMSECQISLISQFVHKCSRQASYLFITYQCVSVSANQEMCQTSNMVGSNIFLSSPNFPNEYASDLNCSCILSTNAGASISIETLFFLLQDNDYLHISPDFENLSGHLPMYTSLQSENFTEEVKISFATDHSLSFSGFWLNLKGFTQCPSGWHGLDKNCFKIIPGDYMWQDALAKCNEIGGNLPMLENVWENRQFRAWLKLKGQQSVWLGFNSPTGVLESHTWMWSSDLSWWPWSDSKAASGSCVISKDSGWKIVSCEERHFAVCQLKMGRSSAPLTLACEQKMSELLLSHMSDALLNNNNFMHGEFKDSSEMKSRMKSETIIRDQGMLTLVLSVFSGILIIVNIGVCFLCYRRLIGKHKKPDLPWEYNKECFGHETTKNIYPQQSQRMLCNELCSGVANYHIYETIVGTPSELKKAAFSVPIVGNQPLCCCCRRQNLFINSMSRRSPESGYSSTNRECCLESHRATDETCCCCCIHDECCCSLYMHQNPKCS